MAEVPEVEYAFLGEDRLAYQVFGEGDVDLLYLPGFADNCIDLRWDWPRYAESLRRLGASARVISFDRGGSGASDNPSGDALPSWERWADEARCVLDAAGSERAVILGVATGSGPTAILFAASHPARTRGLILINASARYEPDVGYPGGSVPVEVAAAWLRKVWGTDAVAEFAVPDGAKDPSFRRWFNKLQRLSLTPKEAAEVLRLDLTLDVRDHLASIQVPTLVLHQSGFTAVPVEQGRYLADHIPGARFAMLRGRDAGLHSANFQEGLVHIEDFLAKLHDPIEPVRALAAILFTDIVGSTAKASALGDRSWRTLLESHDAVVRTVVDQHRGNLVKMTGDGMLATFDGPGRAIRCATALREALRPLGLEIRAGLHTGEIEILDTDIAGIGVHIAARVLDSASPGDLLVSGAVPMLVAGSGIAFEDRGEHELKGVPGTWRLHAVVT